MFFFFFFFLLLLSTFKKKNVMAGVLHYRCWLPVRKINSIVVIKFHPSNPALYPITSSPICPLRQLFRQPEKPADNPRRHHWFPRKMTSELMTRQYQNLGSDSDWLKNCLIQSEAPPRCGWWQVIRMEFLKSFLRRHFPGKAAVASRDVGCFPKILCFFPEWEVLPTMAYTGSFRPNGVSFSDFRYMKGYGFHYLKYIKGREICHLSL